MCGRARAGLSAPHICARWGGVDPGAQSDNTGPHGPAPLPAGAAGNPAQTPVLQRVSCLGPFFYYYKTIIIILLMTPSIKKY